MPARYLLDTNVLSELMKNPRGDVARRIGALASAGTSVLMTSVVVAGELRYGAAKKGSAALLQRVEELLESIDVLPLEGETDRHYGAVRAGLEAKGRLIGANDLWIAAHALALDAVLVTDNTSEFGRVENLRVENWLRRPPSR